MPAPYGKDLRERAVEASDRLGLDRAAQQFGVGTASLKRWRRLRRTTGTVGHRPMGGDRKSKLSAKEVDEALGDKADRTLRELTAWFLERLDRAVGRSTVGATLRRMGYNLRAQAIFATERLIPRVLGLRAAFLALQAKLDPSRLVFIDEAGFQVGMHRKRAWRRPRSVVFRRIPRNRGTVTTMIGALGIRGFFASFLIEGATTGDVFCTYVRQILAPALRPGDIVVLDNAAAHRVAGVREAIEAVGASMLFLPPYSPELNPIEACWAKLKTLVRGAVPMTLAQLYDEVAAAMKQVTPQDALGWIGHSGYRFVRTA